MPGERTSGRQLGTGKKLRAALAACKGEALAYGECVKSGVPNVDKGRCEAEFRRLRECAKRVWARR